MNKKTKRVIWIVMAILWMGILFYFSHQPVVKSRGFSMIFAEKIVDIFNIKDVSLGSINHYVRKSAHFISYMVLAIIIMNIFRVKEQSLVKSMILSLLIAILFACTDEFHQLFVDGRGGQVKDVLLDSYGAIFGILVYAIVFGRRFKKK